MSASTVSAPRTCASISAELSTPVTRWPSATSSCVIRPAPHPSSRILLAGGTASLISRGSPSGFRVAYRPTGLPSGAVALMPEL
jgi:hypothetical protein